MSGKELVKVGALERVADVPSGMSLVAFNKFAERHSLSQRQVSHVLELHRDHNASVRFIDRLLNKEIKLPHIEAAYLVRTEVGTLHDSASGFGHDKSAEYQLPIEKICPMLDKLCSEDELGEEATIEAVVWFLCQTATRCGQGVQTWTSVLTTVNEMLEHLLREANERVGDVADVPPQ